MHHKFFFVCLSFVLMALSVLFFSSNAIADGLPEFGLNEKQLKIEADKFATGKGYSFSDRLEDGGVVILQYYKKDGNTGSFALQFVLKNDIYFGNSTHIFVSKESRGFDERQRRVYESMVQIRKIAVENGFVSQKASESDFKFRRGNLILEMSVFIEESFHHFMIVMWTDK
jgi:hypothetical protein